MPSGDSPVVGVTFNDAERYTKWLSIMTGKNYRLPSEAEWEYAARGGTKTAYFWGDDFREGFANCSRCGSRWDGLQTSPVGRFKPNPYGLDDMVGNVRQWVEDCYFGGYMSDHPTDGSPRLQEDCILRCVRGSSFESFPWDLHSARRDKYPPGGRNADLGFRVARTLTP